MAKMALDSVSDAETIPYVSKTILQETIKNKPHMFYYFTGFGSERFLFYTVWDIQDGLTLHVRGESRPPRSDKDLEFYSLFLRKAYKWPWRNPVWEKSLWDYNKTIQVNSD